MADLHSKILDAPGGPNSFNFMQFLGKFDKIVCWRQQEGWRPHLEGVLVSVNFGCFFTKEVFTLPL